MKRPPIHILVFNGILISTILRIFNLWWNIFIIQFEYFRHLTFLPEFTSPDGFGAFVFYVFVILHPIIVLLFCWPICDHSNYENSLLKHIMAVLACVASVAHLWVKHSLFELA